MNGKKVAGELVERDKARRIYEDIVRRMKDPSLLEYVGHNVIKAHMYPIPRREETRIALAYTQILTPVNGVYKYSYPFASGTRENTPIEHCVISVNIQSYTPIKNVYSPTYKMEIHSTKYEAHCGYENSNFSPKEDFLLYYSVSANAIGGTIMSYREKYKDGYFMMLLSPGDTDMPALDKDVVFVLDTSGSMDGKKIEQAKDALRFCINALHSGDRFTIVQFASTVTRYESMLVPATHENTMTAHRFIDHCSALGSTNLNEALVTSLRMFSDDQRPHMIVFLTDGEPTEGITRADDILKNCANANGASARIFVFGVGDNVNTHLLDTLATQHNGSSDYVRPQENIETIVSSFYTKISAPVLSDISLSFGDIAVSDMLPMPLPDIFKGTQLVVFGKYEGHGSAKITLTGNMNNETKTFVFEHHFPSEDTDNAFIPRLWATRKIGYLTNEIRLHGENKECVNQIVALSKEFCITTSKT